VAEEEMEPFARAYSPVADLTEQHLDLGAKLQVWAQEGAKGEPVCPLILTSVCV